MNVHKFLEHHGVTANPFAEEDAQSDPVFKEHCIATTFHPAWDKIFGEPAEPATAIVFGEKGSGKTALRLQIARSLAAYNQTHPQQQVFVVEYDDFNPFLDRYYGRLPLYARASAPLKHWKLWDHMDAILALAVTELVDLALGGERPGRRTHTNQGPLELARLGRYQARDLLLLAACYDQSTDEPLRDRWRRLARKLRYKTWRSHWATALGTLVSLTVPAVVALAGQWQWLASPWPYVFVLAGWLPWLVRMLRRQWQAMRIAKRLRAVNREANTLRQLLSRFTADELAGQPLPLVDRSDDRFALLVKLQSILQTLGYAGLVVLVDRIDEPHLVKGSPSRMRDLLWPLLDNKFLKHPGLGLKLLLPIELLYLIEREGPEFHETARLDKQNVIRSLAWTGETLYDVANARLAACAADGRTPRLRDFFQPAVSDNRLLDVLRQLRVPRHMFKLLYRVFARHCSQHSDERPVWQVASETLEAELAVYQREQEALERAPRA